MEKPDHKVYRVLSIGLILAIAALTVFVIIPKYSPAAPEKIIKKIDFSNSAWIEQYVENSVGIFGKDFFLNTAFSYNIRSNKMIVTYASQKGIEEAREYYLALPGAEQSGRNDETSLDVTAEFDGQVLQAYNYYSLVARVFELELTLDASAADHVISQLEGAFPAEELANISEIEDLVAGELFGGYVRYRYDNLDDYAYPFTPIYSRAYLYDGTEADYEAIIQNLNEIYSDRKYDQTQETNYYKIKGQIVSVSFLVTDTNETVVSISIQAAGNQE